MRIINYINGVEGVVTGGTATGNIPINRRYHALKIFVTAGGGVTAAADILDSVRLLVNGVLIRDLLPADIINIALLNGITASTGEVPIFFSEPWRASVVGEEATSWDLFGQSKCTLELKFKTGLTTPAASVLASFDYGRNITDGKPFLSIVKQLTQSFNAPAGAYDLTTLPTSYPIQRVHLKASTGTISAIEVMRDNEKVQESTTAQNIRFLADYKMAGAAFSFPIVFDFSQQISDALIVNRILNIRATSSAANTLTAVIENRVPGFF